MAVAAPGKPVDSRKVWRFVGAADVDNAQYRLRIRGRSSFPRALRVQCSIDIRNDFAHREVRVGNAAQGSEVSRRRVEHANRRGKRKLEAIADRSDRDDGAIVYRRRRRSPSATASDCTVSGARTKNSSPLFRTTRSCSRHDRRSSVANSRKRVVPAA